jgi:hypothetical protein
MAKKWQLIAIYNRPEWVTFTQLFFNQNVTSWVRGGRNWNICSSLEEASMLANIEE